MTKRQTARMLRYENLLMAGGNLAATLALGTLAGWGVCRMMEEIGADYVSFSFPSPWFLLYEAISIGLPFLVTWECMKNF